MGRYTTQTAHDGVCEYCRAYTPCEEPDCAETPGHEYVCQECLVALRERVDPFDSACERRWD